MELLLVVANVLKDAYVRTQMWHVQSLMLTIAHHEHCSNGALVDIGAVQ